MSGGRDLRLGSMTSKLPNPLLPVDEAPFLNPLLLNLARHGIRKILLLGGNAAAQIINYAAATPLKARFDFTVEVTVEPEPAGGGGALLHARHQLDDSFFLLNGDSLFRIHLLDLRRRVV